MYASSVAARAVPRMIRPSWAASTARCQLAPVTSAATRSDMTPSRASASSASTPAPTRPRRATGIRRATTSAAGIGRGEGAWAKGHSSSAPSP